ncbi:MAG: sigma factor, partial [Bacillota bacterium]|nr:sigma factor [Bacillota bacterium]
MSVGLRLKHRLSALRVRLVLYAIRRGLISGHVVLYVGNGEVLPPPLSSDEESALLARLERGDSQVKGELIERNLRLVVYIARKFENTGIGVEDLVSIGTIGLIKAVNT